MKEHVGFYKKAKYGQNIGAGFPEKWDCLSDEIINFIYNKQSEKNVNIQPFIGFEISGGNQADRDAAKQDIENYFSGARDIYPIELENNSKPASVSGN